MSRERTRTIARTIGALVAGCCLLAAVAPGAALAAAGAPVLRAPAPGASVTATQAVEFSWSGALQGAASEQSRSMFRVEIADAADVPPGQDAEWTSLANFALTTPGQPATSATLGAPASGSYQWRVCAWGVVDPNSSNELVSIACSPGQALTTHAVASTEMGAVGEMAMPGHTTVVTGQNNVITRTRTTRLPADPATNVVKTMPVKAAPVLARPTFDTGRVRRALGSHDAGAPPIKAPDVKGLSLSTQNDSGWGSALGGLGNLGSGVVGALGWHLPGVPIPFWTLLLLMMPIPLAFWWKKSVLGMFDMPTVGDLSDEALAFDPDADASGPHSGFKQFPELADGPTTNTTSDDSERLAA